MNGGIFHLSIFFDDDLNDGGVQLRLVTLWRGLPKKTLDPNRTRAPDAARRAAAADAEYVDVEALFALLGVPLVEETNDA